MAPSTPPPPSNDVLAAFTIASTRCCAMSPTMTAMRWGTDWLVIAGKAMGVSLEIRLGRTVLDLASFKPLFERALAFAGRMAPHNIFHADVFVQGRPMNSFAAADKPPTRTFFCRRVQQPRIPRQRCFHRAPVSQFQPECVLVDDNR